MATTPQSPAAERLEAGRASLAEGNWEEARRSFEAASPERDSPEALEGLGMASWWLEEYASGIEARECAYRLYRTRGDMVGAARMAVWLCHDYADIGATPRSSPRSHGRFGPSLRSAAVGPLGDAGLHANSVP